MTAPSFLQQVADHAILHCGACAVCTTSDLVVFHAPRECSRLRRELQDAHGRFAPKGTAA